MIWLVAHPCSQQAGCFPIRNDKQCEMWCFKLKSLYFKQLQIFWHVLLRNPHLWNSASLVHKDALSAKCSGSNVIKLSVVNVLAFILDCIIGSHFEVLLQLSGQNFFCTICCLSCGTFGRPPAPSVSLTQDSTYFCDISVSCSGFLVR